MAHEQASASAAARIIVRNIGLMLSGDLSKPLLDADSILVEDGLIRAVGRSADMPEPVAGDVVIDAQSSAVCPGLVPL